MRDKPADDVAASTGAAPFTIANLLAALFTAERSFIAIGFGSTSLAGSLVVLFGLLLFLDPRKALATACLALVALKLFFFFVYPGYYRHSSLFFILMIALAWIEAEKGWLQEWKTEDPRPRAAAWHHRLCGADGDADRTLRGLSDPEPRRRQALLARSRPGVDPGPAEAAWRDPDDRSGHHGRGGGVSDRQAVLADAPGPARDRDAVIDDRQQAADARPAAGAGPSDQATDWPTSGDRPRARP